MKARGVVCSGARRWNTCRCSEPVDAAADTAAFAVGPRRVEAATALLVTKMLLLPVAVAELATTLSLRTC